MAEKGGHKHFMHKEIHEQPRALADTLRGRVPASRRATSTSTGCRLDAKFVQRLEQGADPRLRHELARRADRQADDRDAGAHAGRGRPRLRVPLPRPAGRRGHALHRDLAVGRDGRHARGASARRSRAGRATLAICNVVGSAIAREADDVLYTHAGPEIGVASTKAFTTQLAALFLLAVRLGRLRGTLSASEAQRAPAGAARSCRCWSERVLKYEELMKQAARKLQRRPRRALPRPRPAVSGRAGGRAQAQGDLLHPRRGLRRGRDEARPHRADRREHAGGGARAARLGGRSA